MEFQMHSHRSGYQHVTQNPLIAPLWAEIESALEEITDEDLKREFLGDNPQEVDGAEIGRTKGQTFHAAKKMSLSDAINRQIKLHLESRGWVSEAAIFQGAEYSSNNIWRLDFSKQVDVGPGVQTSGSSTVGIAVEVAFNHGEAIAWNLLKPKLAAELNHVAKQVDIGDGIGVIICATRSLKQACAFDGAVGEYEKILRYLKPLQGVLTVPLVIIGLDAPKSFKIEKLNISNDPRARKNVGVLIDLDVVG